MQKYNSEIVSDSSFIADIPYGRGGDWDEYYHGKYVIEKISVVSETAMTENEKYDKLDHPYVYYYVSEEQEDTTEGYLQLDWNYIDAFSFNYGQNVCFYAESPDGKFTSQEEKEVIKILSSFRHD